MRCRFATNEEQRADTTIQAASHKTNNSTDSTPTGGPRIAGRRGGPPANTEGWTETFLTAIAEGAHVRLAAARAKVHFTLPYKRRRFDAAFRAAWDEATELGTEALEHEAVRRAYHGVEEPVFYEGVQCGSVTKYSDKLLMVLLKARNPAKYREGSGAESAPGPVSININIVEKRAGAPEVGDFRAITDGRILPASEMR
jgi:hypothetical protein